MAPYERKYALITAAYNEERFIAATIESILRQTVLPRRWAIVSDGSTDRTDEIVLSYCAENAFIQLVRVPEKHKRNFGAQVLAIRRGYEALRGADYDFIANLDADLTFDPDYYERLLQKFDQDPKLGLAGGYVLDRQRDGQFRSRPMNAEHSVAHGVQMLRRRCYEETDGWIPLPYGGPDWHLQLSVQMRGWRARAFKELHAYHHRPTGSAARPFQNYFREGRMDYSIGSYPLFEIFKVARRYRIKPYFIASSVRMLGFLWGYWRGEARPVSQEFIGFVRSQQKAALRKFLHLQPRVNAVREGRT
jgi:poly-beta-1,6-N-acetyl-D-glucosamine synthase